MAFSVATNNRFDLFVDDDEEADELLTKQQREVAVERQRRDSDKRSGKAKTGGRQVAGKGQTQPNTVIKPASDDKTVKAATPSSGKVLGEGCAYTSGTRHIFPLSPRPEVLCQPYNS